jgi:hypothetical protein
MKRLLLLSVLVMLALSASASAAPTRVVDLTTGRMDGHLILGRTVAEVTAVLGRPDFRSGPRSSYRIGWGARPDFAVEVIFRPSGGVERAWSIAFERGPVRDVRLGDLLGRSSAALQSAVRSRYADTFKLLRPFACKNGRCVGEFAARSGTIHVTFGTHGTLGTWLTVWQAPSA